MNRSLLYIILALFLIGLISCKKGGFFLEGELSSEERQLPAFSYIEIRDVFDVTLKQSDSPGIIITGGEALIPGIKTLCTNDSLIIINDNRFDWTRKYRKIELTILTDSTDKITLIEPCNLKTDGIYSNDKLTIWATSNLSEIDLEIDTDYFYLYNSWLNTGNYRVRGRTDYALLWINGTGKLDASELLAEELYVKQRSLHDMKINVSRQLTYNIRNSGNIILYRVPDIIIEELHNGSGELIIATQDQE